MEHKEELPKEKGLDESGLRMAFVPSNALLHDRNGDDDAEEEAEDMLLKSSIH